jgi:hypothetical protein
VKARPTNAQPVGCGSVRADEVLTLREFGRRLVLATRALCDAQRGGLKTILVGRVKFVLGSDALDWFRQQQGGGSDD